MNREDIIQAFASDPLLLKSVMEPGDPKAADYAEDWRLEHEIGFVTVEKLRDEILAKAALLEREDVEPPYFAPYQFVPMPGTVELAEQVVDHDVPLKDGYCGAIEYSLIAETPLSHFGNHYDKDPQFDPDRVPPIYGTAIRGLLRNSCAIIAHGRLSKGNWHHHYGLRDFEHPWYKGEAGLFAGATPPSVVDPTCVKAGLLRLRSVEKHPQAASDNFVYEITPLKKGWAFLEVAPAMMGGPSYVNKDQLNDMRNRWANRSLSSKYGAIGIDLTKEGPFTTSLGFDLVAGDRGKRIAMRNEHGTERGTPVFAGPLPGKNGEKRWEAVFLRSPQEHEPIIINKQVADIFVAMYTKPSGERQGTWEELGRIAEEAYIPVFYTGDPAAIDPHSFFFGLTRLFKVPHRYSVGDVVSIAHKSHVPPAMAQGEAYRPDLVENLFGYVIEPQDVGLDPDVSHAPNNLARKGRVSFSALRLSSETPARLSEPVNMRLMGPRASYAPFYLVNTVQDNNREKDFSPKEGGRIALAGRKRYVPRYEGLQPQSNVGSIQQRSGVTGAAAATDSQVRFLLPQDVARPLTFSGRIELHNVTRAEIGLILYALTHGNDGKCRFMVGRARPQGAGQMRLGYVRLTLVPNDPANADELNKLPHDDRLAACVAAFERRMRDAFAWDHTVAKWRETATPKEPTGETALYMTLDAHGDLRKAVQTRSADKNAPTAPFNRPRFL